MSLNNEENKVGQLGILRHKNCGGEIEVSFPCDPDFR